jgi:hypothetical protein
MSIGPPALISKHVDGSTILRFFPFRVPTIEGPNPAVWEACELQTNLWPVEEIKTLGEGEIAHTALWVTPRRLDDTLVRLREFLLVFRCRGSEMVTLMMPADGLKAFEVGPTVFMEIAAWAKRERVRIIQRTVVHGADPVVLVAYSLAVAA